MRHGENWRATEEVGECLGGGGRTWWRCAETAVAMVAEA